MRDLIKSASYIGSTEIALSVAAVVKNKYLAVTIGPYGFGLFAILSSFFALAAVFGSSWLSTASVKYLSEYHRADDAESFQKVFDFSFSLVLSLSMLLTLVFFACFPLIKAHFLAPEVAFTHYALFAAAFAGTNLTNVFAFLLQALGLVRKVVFIRMVSNLVNLATVVALVHFFGLTGFFVSIPAAALLGLGLYWWDGARLVRVRLRWPRPGDAAARKTFAMGSVSMGLSFANLLSVYLQRIIILAFGSLTVLGMFQAITSLVNYLGVVSRSTSFVYLPRMSARLEKGERDKAINDYLRFAFFTGLPLSAASILLCREGVRILFSPSFAPVADVFYLFVIAAFLSNIEVAFQSVIVGNAFMGIHSIITMVIHTVWVVVPLVCLARYGIASIAFSLMAGSAFSIVASYLFLKKRLDISLGVSILPLLAVAAGTFLLCIHFREREMGFRLALALLCCCGLAATVRKREWRRLCGPVAVRLARK